MPASQRSRIPRARLADVAAHAGVSTATVSRVLNNKPGVAADTQHQVLAAMDYLGYARPTQLVRRTTGLIGLVVPELSNPVFPALAQEMESLLFAAGFTTMLCTQSPGGATESAYIDMLIEHQVDGVIFVSGLHADSTADLSGYEKLDRARIPYYLVNGPHPKLEAPRAQVDDAAAVSRAVQHLYNLGHRRIGLALGQRRFLPSQRKEEGFMAAVERLNLDQHKVVTTFYSLVGGRSAAEVLLDESMTAIICASDLMALGVIKAVRARGLDVPGDVSVIGYDDSPLIAYTDPPLTTIHFPVNLIARAAVRTLSAVIAGDRIPQPNLTFDGELVVRASTAPARQ